MTVGPTTTKRRIPLEALGMALVATAAVAAYWPALHGGFIWDDDGHVTKAALRPLSGLWRIWFEPGATQQYYPVLHSLFWAEYRLWGGSALCYHAANLALHLAASLLLYRVLVRLGVGGASLAAAAFALHPVCVETAAWISEEKNTLSAVFYFASALVYFRFDKERRAGSYAAAIALFALAVLSKSVTATLPAALLVVLWWRRGSLGWRRDIAPLLPWFALSAAAAVVTPWIEHKFVGASGQTFALGAAGRLLVAGRAAWFYLGKILWPANLVFIYPRWHVDAADPLQYAFPAAAAVALIAAFAVRRRTRGPLAAGLLFVGTLFPALGFINVYPFVFSFVADHFQYLAAAGMIASIATALAALATRMPGLGGGLPRAGAFLLLALLAVLTRRQCGDYRDVEVFYRSILDRNPESWLAHDNLGVVLVSRGKPAEAEEHYRQAIRLNPSYPEAYNNLGNVLAHAGRWDEAASAYEGAMWARPDFLVAEVNWGTAMNDAGRYADAESHFRRVIAAGAGGAGAHYGLANALANSGRIGEAITEYRQAVKLEPDSPEAHANLGLALATTGDWEGALAETGEALRLRPGYAEAHAYRGTALAGAGRLEEAVAEFRASLRINPANGDVHYQLAVALRRLGRTGDAADEFEAAGRH